MKLIARTLSLAALLGVGSIAHAQLAFDFTEGVISPVVGTATAGYTFSVLSPITITELDVFNPTTFKHISINLNSNPIPVGIWDTGGTLLTSTSISTSSPAFTTPSVSGTGSYFGVGIAPLALAPGDYTIGALYGLFDAVTVTPLITALPQVQYGAAALAAGATLTQPLPVAPGAGLFGPSFKFRAGAAVPEPGSVALLVGLASVGGMILRRKK